mgnify:FL=1
MLTKELREFVKVQLEKIDQQIKSEADQISQTSDIPVDLKAKVSKKVIPVAFAKSVIVNLFDTYNMTNPVERIPKLSFVKEATTAVVDENSAITTSKVTADYITLQPVKFALRSIITSEMLEDKNEANLKMLDLVLKYDAQSIANEIDQKLMALINAAAVAGDVWWDLNIPSNWADTHPSMEYYDTLFESLTQAAKKVADNHFTPDTILVNPEQAYLVSRLGGFTGNLGDFVGKLGQLGSFGVYSSPFANAYRIYVMQKKIFGVFAEYVPLQYSEKVYNAQYDRWEMVIRGRFAYLVTVGQAIARVLLYNTYENEEPTVGGDLTGNLAHAPVKPDSITATDWDSGTSTGTDLTVVTWDSRFDAEPTPGAGEIAIDIETGAFKLGGALTGDTLRVTYSAVPVSTS